MVGPGRFTLVKELGRGGMGVVWLAQDTSLGEQVALKFLPPEVCHDPVALNDLRRETVRSHRLTHPNIVRLHDFHQQPDGVAFISMEYVDGPTLSGWRLQQVRQVFTWDQLAPLVTQLCTALEYAHGEGVIHRDLKPANVMLDSRGRVKLADFGIATVVSDSMSRVSARSSTSGTLAYMSPQQLAGKMPSVADDVYALGATLYELVTGRPPFHTGDITHQVLHVAPTPVQERLLDLGVDNPVPEHVAALVMACLAKEPEKRPQSAAAVAAWSAAAQSGSPDHLAPGDAGMVPEARAARTTGIGLRKVLMWAGGTLALLLFVCGLVHVFGGKRKLGGRATVSSTQSPDLASVRWTNSLGMVFVPVPGTDVKFSIWETRVRDFEAFVNAANPDMGNQLMMGRSDGWKNRPGYNWRNPGFPQGPTHPVVGVNWADAQAFCRWLTEKEQAAGFLTAGQRYRLPTDAEWSAAVGPAKFPWGDTWPPPPRAGNYGGTETAGADWPGSWGRMTNYGDGHVFSAPVGSYTPNALGLFDMGGNAWEWCEDYYRAEMNPEDLRAVFKSMLKDGGGQRKRVFRGASWVDPQPEILASANRLGTGDALPEGRCDTVGFRVALATGSATSSQHAESVAPDGLRQYVVLHFTFDRAEPGGKVTDLSGQGNHGQAVGAQWTAEGKRGGGCSFGPVKNCVTVPNSESLNPRELTWALWIKTSHSEKVWLRLIDKCFTNGYAMSVAGIGTAKSWKGEAWWEVGATGRVAWTTSGRRIDDGQWHHVVGTFSEPELRLYVDGALVRTALKASMKSNACDLTLGLGSSTPGEIYPGLPVDTTSFDGVMDEVMLFKRALSATEIRGLYDEQK